MEIEIIGEGELVLRFIDKAGRTLLQERLTVSGAPAMRALRVVDLSLRTADGDAALAPLVVSQTNAKQRVTFDGAPPARFTRQRCKEIGCTAQVAADAARGVAPPPVGGDGPARTIDDLPLDRLLRLTQRGR